MISPYTVFLKRKMPVMNPVSFGRLRLRRVSIPRRVETEASWVPSAPRLTASSILAVSSGP